MIVPVLAIALALLGLHIAPVHTVGIGGAAALLLHPTETRVITATIAAGVIALGITIITRELRGSGGRMALAGGRNHAAAAT